jgi:hypothetical protein
MPQRIQMNLTNPISFNIVTPSLQNSAPNTALTGVRSLNSSMIARIHNVRPGCGSCGRH